MAATRLFVVVGLGQFGGHVARSLCAAGQEVLAVDKSMERVEALKDQVTRAVRLDCTSEEAMRAMGVEKAAAVIIALGEEDFEAAVLGTAVVRGLGVSMVVARSSSPQRGKILELAGATRVVYPEAEMGEQLAHLLLHRSLRASAELQSGFTLAEVKVPARISGQRLDALELRSKQKLVVLAVQRKGKLEEPSAEWTFQEGDVVLLAGRRAQVAGLAESWEPGG